MATLSIRRLSDATLAKYQRIIDDGGTLTPRQQKALDGHRLITNRAFVDALLRPGKENETMYSLDELAKLYASRYGMATKEVLTYLKRYSREHKLSNFLDVVEAGRALATMTGWQQHVTDDALYQETEGWAREQGLFSPVPAATPRRRK